MPKGTYWKPEQVKFLWENAMQMCPAELAKHVGRDTESVRKKMRRDKIPHITQRQYTDADKEFIEEHWGTKSIRWIAQQLGKDEDALDVYTRKVLQLGSARENVLEFRVSQIAEAMKIDRNIVYKWHNKYGLPLKSKLFCKERKNLIIKEEDLMKWLKANQDKWKADKIEFYALGSEPDWLKLKRKRDVANKDGEKYTQQQIQSAINQWYRGRSIEDIAKEYGRSSSKGLREAMNRRIKSMQRSRQTHVAVGL